MKIFYAIPLIALLWMGASCSRAPATHDQGTPAMSHSVENDAMKEHCKSMPEMPGCEQFNLSGSVTTGAHTMDHASMVTDEISFLSEMIPHHQEAIDTSAHLLTQTSNTGLKLILINIMSGQANEIKMMKGRLSDNYSGVDYKAMYMPMMRDTKNITDMKVLEKMYMEDMITHHQ